MLSVYEGHTVFSIFFYNPQFFNQIYTQIRSRSFEDTVDDYKNPTEDIFLRRLYRIIMMPTADNLDVSQKCQFNTQYWCKKCLNPEVEGVCRCRGFYPLA